MDGIWSVSRAFDAAGTMAKPVTDLAAVTEVLLTNHARNALPDTGFTPSLTLGFKGLPVGMELMLYIPLNLMSWREGS